jgi:hypothetical protein
MIDLEKFCSTDLTRPYLMKPFTIGEWTYATNGRICVRVPAMAEWPSIEKTIAAPELFAAPVTEFRPLPKIEFPPPDEDDECESCNGRGCEHDCPDCECICEQCNGTGEVPPYSNVSVEIGNGIYAGRYIHLLQSLPSVEIGPPHKRERMQFRFAGGEGCLMPRNGEADIHIVTGA